MKGVFIKAPKIAWLSCQETCQEASCDLKPSHVFIMAMATGSSQDLVESFQKKQEVSQVVTSDKFSPLYSIARQSSMIITKTFISCMHEMCSLIASS